eukprot:CAMPEP_0198126696 /NCGR_PEP_ID=MMETSP1442-20131203/45451_1 /TAXON_ID= /ORGANISM="Craspedostauros australis, Strain CCMP3328" /LENGTH=57 /DNA_ID=CAMNT_0043786533 /DNA_START=235 /DNA_END=404 /DNA_ORIENTATION=-
MSVNTDRSSSSSSPLAWPSTVSWMAYDFSFCLALDRKSSLLNPVLVTVGTTVASGVR